MSGWADLKALTALAEKSGGLGRLGPAHDVSPSVPASNSLSSVKGRAVFGLRIEPTAAVFEGRARTDLTGYTNGAAGSMLGELPGGSVGGLAVSGVTETVKKELAVLDKSPMTAAGPSSRWPYRRQYGIKLPDDALNMLGNEFAAGVDAVPPAGGAPDLRQDHRNHPTH